MDSEEADWGLAEWRVHSEWLETALESAMHNWGRAVQELEKAGKTLETMAGNSERESSLLSKALLVAEETQKQREKLALEKRGRGRPRKVVDDTFLLNAFNEMKAEFQAANKFQKPTDNAVLTWYFGRQFERYGRSASYAKSPEFQSKLKRFQNRLGDVRNPIHKTPI